MAILGPYAKMMLNKTCVLWLTIAITGCSSTVIPQKVVSGQPSWDGTNQNSGVISFNKKTGTGFVTAQWHDDYFTLLPQYGKYLKRLPLENSGIIANPDGTYTVTGEILANMGVMEIYKKAGR